MAAVLSANLVPYLFSASKSLEGQNESSGLNNVAQQFGSPSIFLLA